MNAIAELKAPAPAAAATGFHPAPGVWRSRPVLIDLVGVGGTGSLLLTELARLHLALTAPDGLGMPQSPGLYVSAWDPELVSSANIGRTMFAPSDIGRAKSEVLVSRINLTYGLLWRAFSRSYDHETWRMDTGGHGPDIVITCVDSLRARADLHRALMTGKMRPPFYWLDCGNDVDTGQVVLGEPEWEGDPDRFQRLRRPRLRTVADVFPEMLAQAETEAPEPESCSLVTALDRQSLTINRWMSTAAFELLWQLFRHGGLTWHAAFVNARTGRMNSIPIQAPSAAAQRKAADLVGAAAEFKRGPIV